MWNWDGVFSPIIKSVVGSIQFIDISNVSIEDWSILDYDNLRPVAKNRIADMIVNGTLTGFFRVNVLTKAKTKPHYYWPADEEMMGKYSNDDHSFFVNEQDVDDTSSAADEVDNAIAVVAGTRVATIAKFVDLVKGVNDKDNTTLNSIKNELSDDSTDSKRLAVFKLITETYRVLNKSGGNVSTGMQELLDKYNDIILEEELVGNNRTKS